MRPLVLAASLVLLSACNATETVSPPSVVAPDEALCRPTPNGRNVTGCYVTLTASRNDRLVSVESPLAAQGQIHEMKIQNGIMSMAELKAGLALPAGEAVVLKPGGNHIMLIGLSQPLKAGETVLLSLSFETAPPVQVQARVGQPQVGSGSMHH